MSRKKEGSFSQRKRRPLLARLLLRALKNIHYGTLRLTTPRGVLFTFRGKEGGAQADIHIHDWEVVRHALKRGDIGFGEDYIDGLWETDDLPALLTLLTMNMKYMEQFFHGHWYHGWMVALRQFFKRNDKKPVRKNIEAHYDASNAFYQLWLDETMTYSAAIFEGNDGMPLRRGQEAKYQRILNKLDEKQAEILEIGCGWGAFSEAAAKAHHRVKAVTISPAEHVFATQRLAAQKLDDQVEIRLQDYRDVKGVFDAVVSIEMFEALGEQSWPSFFRTVKHKLKHGGRALVQTIVIGDAEFEAYRRRNDFIRQYSFPGGMLCSLARFKKEAANAGLATREIYAFGKDYAITLHKWLKRFDEKKEEIMAMGHGEDFIRHWRFFLAYSIAGFATGRTDVVQIELVHD